MNKLMLSAALFALAAGAAQAADPPMMPPVVDAPTVDWSGFYAGIHGGGQFGDVFADFDLIPPPGPPIVILPVLPYQAAVFGGQLGANIQMGKFVLGAEGRIAWVSGTANNGGFAGVTDTVDMNFTGSALVRAGIALNKVMPYLVGGVTAINYDYQLSNGATRSATNVTNVGGTVGVGLEVMVTKRISLFGEYNHTWTGNTNFTVAAAAGPPAITGEILNSHLNFGTALFGLNVHW